MTAAARSGVLVAAAVIVVSLACARASASEADRGAGFRAGAFLPTDGDGLEYDTDPLVGVYYRRGILEAGLDVGATERANSYDSVPVVFRLDALLGRSEAYLLAGGAFVVEFVHDDRDGTRHVNGSGAVDLGAGITVAGGRVDLRFVYQVLLDSDNVDGQPLLTAGWRF
jgi:hypothetical protein